MLGVMSIQEFFAQLYAHADLNHESNTGGRSMNAHFASRYINPDGSWKNQTGMYNTSADVSPTAAQMPRTVGLAYASVVYRGLEELKEFTQFSKDGNEVTFTSIGNASTSEGMFWEVGQCHRCVAGTCCNHGLRRRLRHFGPQPIPDGQGKYPQYSAGLSARSRAPSLNVNAVTKFFKYAVGIIRHSSKPMRLLLRSHANITSLRWCMSMMSHSRRDIPHRAATSDTRLPIG